MITNRVSDDPTDFLLIPYQWICLFSEIAIFDRHVKIILAIRFNVIYFWVESHGSIPIYNVKKP